MGEGADAEGIHAGGGDGVGGLQVDAAGGLELGDLGGGAGDGHALAHQVARHIVEHNPFGLGAQGGLELLDGLDLDLDGQEGIGLARGLDGEVQALGVTAGPEGAMVILHQHAVVEAEAMVGAAAAAHGKLLEDAQAGGRLARIQDHAIIGLDRLDELVGERGGAAHALDEVERGALGSQDGAGAAGKAGQDAAGGGQGTIGDEDLVGEGGVEHLQDVERHVEPGHAAGLAGLDFAGGQHVGPHEGEGGGVARANILLQRGADGELRARILGNVRQSFGVCMHRATSFS